MKFNINSQIFEQYPDYKLGVILIKGMDNSRRISSVESLLRGVCAQKEKQYKGKDIDSDLMIKIWNQVYGNFGINPKKFSPSIRALLKRVANGKEIPHINALVDIYNYYSLKYLLPIGSEDLDWLCGDLTLRFTKEGECFRPLGSIDIEKSKEGEVAYVDKGGITCRYWNHRECERTKITNKTVNAVIFMEDISKMHMDEFGRILNEMSESVRKYLGGTITTTILNEDNSSLDLEIKGRQTADDSKISAQEKAFFLAKNKKTKELNKNDKNKKEKNIDNKFVSKKEKKFNLTDLNTLKEKVRLIIKQAIIKTFPKPLNIEPKVEYPKSKEHGDYATNIAMQLAKDLGENPRKIAEKLIKNINEENFIKSVEIAGPGFINIFISDEYLKGEIDFVLEQKENYGKSEIGEGKTILVEYSSPNIAKPLGVHHLITTILGQSLCNLYKYLGFNAISLNYLGDWGTQFGKLITAYKKWGDKEIIEKDPIKELLKLYIKFHEEAEKDQLLEDEARREFRIFEEGDTKNKKIWKWFVKVSLIDVQKTYDFLGGIHFDNMDGESFFEDKLAEMLKDGKERGIFVEGKEGSYIVEYEDPNIPPFLVQKKDGATLYSTRDFAALKYRISNWQPLKIIYVVGSAQILHFKQLFTGAKRFPWYHGEATHVWFGRMSMKDKKLSTRKGNVVLLDEVLKEGVKRAKTIIKEKSKIVKNINELAKKLGIGAIKYNILSQNRTSNITFDWDIMLSLDGNSAPYLQYSYARAKSIIRKADEEWTESGAKKDTKETKEKIHALIREIPKFSENIMIAAQEYKPNILSNYLFRLAQEFNSFYNAVSVNKAETEEDKEFRLKLVKATSQILKNGLALLGIDIVEEM